MKKRNAFVLTLVALIFSSPLRAQNPPSSIEGLRTLPNANEYWRAGLTQSPYAATLSNNVRVVYTFYEGTSGYPYMKTGEAAPICSNRMNDDCMMGVIRIITFEWFTYWRTSDRSKFWLCIVYHSGSEPWFRCYEAQAGRTNTIPEVYNITMIAGQKFIGQVPAEIKY